MISQIIKKIIQTGYIKARVVGENIRVIFEVIEDVKTFTKPGLLLLADVKQAFDG